MGGQGAKTCPVKRGSGLLSQARLGVEEAQCLSSPGGGAKNQRCSNHSNKSCH